MNEYAVAETERLREAEGGQGRTAAERWHNLVEMFFDQAEQLGAMPFLWRKTGGAWHPTNWDEAARIVASLATALAASGIQRGDRVMIVSENRPEFCLWDLAVMAAGAVSVPTYISNTVRDHLHVLENSGAAAVVVSTPALARTVIEAAFQASACRLVIGIEPLKLDQAHGDLRFADMADLLAAHPADVAKVRSSATMGRPQLACIIYTSGTGGAPRGVMQHHGAILHNVAGCLDIILNDFPAISGRDTFLSFLPPSHAFEHTAGQFLPIALGGEIYYAEGLERLGANIGESRPTIMVVVPRLFEVFRQRIVKEAARKGGMAERMLGHALALGRRRQELGRLPLLALPLDFLVERLVRRPLQQRFGGRLRAMVSGGAPLSPEVGSFFAALGITVLQGYGQTEAGPVISCNRPAAGIRMDSVGPPLRETEVVIADDGEILVNGELVMLGYWRDEAATEAALRDGWLHTGDIGRIDDEGHLVITDRKKDIIINDKGENVAPQRIEGMLTLEPEISQAMVYGDRRPYLVAVIVPAPEYRMEWAARHGRDMQTLDRDPEFARSIQAAVDRVNARLAAPEKVRRIIVASEAFSVENGQTTPSLKLKRDAVRAAYGARLDALYR